VPHHAQRPGGDDAGFRSSHSTTQQAKARISASLRDTPPETSAMAARSSKNARQSSMGAAINGEAFADRVRLTPAGINHILGIQGELWSENLRDSRSVEYMAFPRMIALAERAWAKSPNWATIESTTERAAACDTNWNEFANRLGQRELPRLDSLCGGVEYRLPPPGAKVRDGSVIANVDFPGLKIRYTVDGSEPGESSKLYDGPISASGKVKLRSFDTRGRGSRTSEPMSSNK